MLVQTLHEHFVSVGPFVTWTREVDGVKFGDPNREIDTIATVWKPTFAALRQAQAQGAQLVVAHESVFVKGGPLAEEEIALPSEQEKLAWLKASLLLIYRSHDLWDQFPELGIRDTWQRELRLNGRIVADRFPLFVTAIAPTTVGDLARHVLERIRPLGQTMVMVMGDLDQVVSRIATGTGVTTDPMAMWDLGADIGIVTDDYFLHVREGSHARERNFPLLSVNHGVAEEWGLQNLAVYLRRTFPQLKVVHIPQTCPFTVVS